MPITEYWKEIATGAVMNGEIIPFSTVYAGLGAGSFLVDVNGGASGEITGAGYSRQQVSWSDWVTDRTNGAELLWSVDGSWPSVGALFLADASQGGRVLAYATFTAVGTSQGDGFRVAAGSLVLT